MKDLPSYTHRVTVVRTISTCASLRTDNQVMKKELSNARNERDNIQYRLNLLKEDLELAVQRKEEAERKEKEEHESGEQARGQLVRGEEGVKGEGRGDIIDSSSVCVVLNPENSSGTAEQSRETKDRSQEGDK